jgi:hypothetical protein
MKNNSKDNLEELNNQKYSFKSFSEKKVSNPNIIFDNDFSPFDFNDNLNTINSKPNRIIHACNITSEFHSKYNDYHINSSSKKINFNAVSIKYAGDNELQTQNKQKLNDNSNLEERVLNKNQGIFNSKYSSPFTCSNTLCDTGISTQTTIINFKYKDSPQRNINLLDKLNNLENNENDRLCNSEVEENTKWYNKITDYINFNLFS